MYKNFYNVNDLYSVLPVNFSIDNENYVTFSYDNSEGSEIVHLELFNNINRSLKKNTTYYVILEIADISGTGGIILTDSATEIDKFQDLKIGDILKYPITTLEDYDSSDILLKTIFRFWQGESGSIKFRISLIDEDIDVSEFEYSEFQEQSYELYLDERNYINIPNSNIKYLVSVRESDIPNMPDAEETAVEIKGRDGDLVLSTKYKPMNFVIVAYTEDNLSPKEKIAEINKMTRFMNSVKNNTKKMAFIAKEKMYPVKYNGKLVTEEYPKHVRFEIPLKSSKSYATDLTRKMIVGPGIKESNTIEDTGCIITIHGPAQTPVIALNDYQMKYDNVILEGNKLVINTLNSTAIMISSEGVTANAAIYYNHQYPKIKYGTNEIKIHSGIDNPNQVITEWYDLKI